jgi:hypothetical protein
MTGRTYVPAFVYVREFDDTENPLEHAITALPELTRPINLTAIPLGFGFLIAALMAVTANWPLTDFALTTFHVAVVPVALVAKASAAKMTTIEATYFIVCPLTLNLCPRPRCRTLLRVARRARLDFMRSDSVT